MRKPKDLEVKKGDRYGDESLTLSHLSDTKKCHIMTSTYGEIISASLNKTEVKKAIKWLNRWLEFKDTNHAKVEGTK